MNNVVGIKKNTVIVCGDDQKKNKVSNQQKMESLSGLLLIARYSKIYFGGRTWCFDDVVVILVCHPLYNKALGCLLDDDNAEPLRDLTIRAARQLACTILKIEPESVGVAL